MRKAGFSVLCLDGAYQMEHLLFLEHTWSRRIIISDQRP
jgi:hypothetical protein